VSGGAVERLRSVTFFIQKQLAHEPGFDAWYGQQQTEMRKDELLRRFVEGRNIIVKERSLLVRSTAQIGIFRNRELKLALTVPVPPYLSSEYLLREHAPKLELIDEEHIFIGEEYGVLREWSIEELGSGNVLKLCDQAWSKIGQVFAAAHNFIGRQWESPPPHVHDPNRCNLLTETDLDPTLPERWGWD
jgi:hypothetical protein